MLPAYSVIVLLMITFLLSQSSSATDVPRDLLSEAAAAAAAVQISPNDTESCCSDSGGCVQSSSLASPWCAFDGNSSTVWILTPGQRKLTLTVNLRAQSLIDRFEVTFDARSLTPSSAVVSLLGSDVTWTTYINQTCPPTETYWRRRGSLYFSCIQTSRSFKLSVLDGLFSIRNGSDGWLWWKTFHQFQLTIDATDADHSNSSASNSIEIADIRLYGWDQPSGQCNCHPVGVNDVNAPCNDSGQCICQGAQDNGDQCIPRLNEVQPTYGPSSGGTRINMTGIHLRGVSRVTVGKDNCSIVNNDDNLIRARTSGGDGPSLPIRLFWEKPEGIRSSVIVDGDFTYKPDPTVYRITPRKSIVRGGISQTVIGRNLDSVAFPFINIITVTGSYILQYNYMNKNFGDGNKDKFCQTVNSTMLTCRSPILDRISYSLGDSRAYIRLSLDFNQYNDYNQCDSDIENCAFLLTENPKPDPWKNDPLQYPVYSERKLLEITGQYFQGGSSFEDYKVTVGDIDCQIVNVINNVISFYPPNASLLDTNKKHQTILSVGYYSFTVGYLQYITEDETRRNAIIGGVVGGIGGFIVLILVIILVVFLLRRRRFEKPTNESNADNHPQRHRGSILDHLTPEERASVEKCLVPFERIHLAQELGKGNFGKVFRGTIISKAGVCEPVAIKSLTGGHHVSKRDKVEFLLEAMLMADFCHAHVLSLIAVVIKHDLPYIVLPLMDFGDLKNFVSNQNNSFTAGDLVSFSFQVAEGMEYLAERKFVHRDLAARNCMISKDYVVKVADFGLARDIFEKDYYRPQDSQRLLPVKWMALECLSSNTEFTEKSDVWSYGVLVWELMTRGKRPYNDIDNLDLKRFLEEERRLEKPQFAPDFMYDLMLRCWHRNRDERPSFKDIVRELKEILSLAAAADTGGTSPSLVSSTTASSVGSQEMNVVAGAKNSYLALLTNPQD